MEVKLVKRIDDEFSGLESPMGRLLARRKAKGLCTKCAKPVTELKRTTGRLMSKCRECLDKMKVEYDKRRG